MLYIFGDQNQISGRSTQVVKTKKTRSAVVISFQVVSRRDGGSKARLALAGWLRLAGGYWLHKVVSLSAQSTFHVKSIEKSSVFEGDMDFDRFFTATWRRHLAPPWPVWSTGSLPRPPEPLQMNLFGEINTFVF